MRALACTLSLALLAAGPASARDLFDASRLRIGVGDRLVLWQKGRPRVLADEAAARGLPLDFLQVWLTRDWQDSWLDEGQLRALGGRGIVPVVVHYWWGDAISRERVEADRDAWYTSLWRMASRLRMENPVLVVLEPEFNVEAAKGQTAVKRWPGFAEELRAAARLIRHEAPNARVGVCAGDFAGPPRLEGVLGPVADDLDFLAVQEMRAVTDPERNHRDGYLDVGRAALEYSMYLQRAFGRPVLLAYVAVSSHRGWEREQAAALLDLAGHANALREAGVFGAIYLQLFDDPEHEGYFGAAERRFGLLRADGTPKPAFSVLRALAQRGRVSIRPRSPGRAAAPARSRRSPPGHPPALAATASASGSR